MHIEGDLHKQHIHWVSNSGAKVNAIPRRQQQRDSVPSVPKKESIKFFKILLALYLLNPMLS